MNVFDDDSKNFMGVGSKRDKIDVILEGFKYLVAGPNSQNPRQYSKSVSKLRFFLRSQSNKAESSSGMEHADI